MGKEDGDGKGQEIAADFQEAEMVETVETDASQEISEQDREIINVVVEGKTAISSEIQDAISRRLQLDKEIEIESSSSSQQEVTRENADSIILAINALCETPDEEFDSAKYVQLGTLNTQANDLREQLVNQIKGLLEEIAKLSKEHDSQSDTLSQQLNHEFDQAEPTLIAYRGQSALIRPFTRIIRGKEISAAMNVETQRADLFKKLTEIEQAQKKIQDEISGLSDTQKRLTEATTNWRPVTKQRDFINSEIVDPAKKRIDEALVEISKPLRAKLISDFLTERVEPVIGRELYREDMMVMTGEEFNDFIYHQIVNSTTKEMVRGIIFSRAPEVLGIEEGSELKAVYHPDSKQFSLMLGDATTVATFPENELMDMYFKLTPGYKEGEKFGDSDDLVVEKWTPDDATLVLKKKDGVLITLRGAEEILRFSGESFTIHRGYGTEDDHVSVAIDDPRTYQAGFYTPEEQWFIRQRTPDRVVLSKRAGLLTGEEGQALIADLSKVMHGGTREERDAVYQSVGENPNYRLVFEDRNAVRDIAQLTRFMDYDAAIRFSLLSRQDRLQEHYGLQGLLPYAPDYRLAGSNDLTQRLGNLYSSFSGGAGGMMAFEHFLDDDLVQRALPQERQRMVDIALQYSRAALNNNEQSPQENDIKILAEFGTSSDFWQALLLSMNSLGLNLGVFENLLEQLPQMRERFAKVGREMLAIDNFLPIFEQFSEDKNPYGYTKKKDRLIEALAPSVRDKIIKPETPPEEKIQLFKTLELRPGSSRPEFLFDASGEMDPVFADQLMLYLRTFSGTEDKVSPAEITEEMSKGFCLNLSRLRQNIESGEMSALTPILSDFNILCFLARHPNSLQGVIDLPVSAPDFLEMIAPGGQFEDNRDQLIHYLFADGDVAERAKSMVSIFRGNEPLPDKLMAFVEARLGDQLRESDSAYPVEIERDGKIISLPFEKLTYDEKKAVLYKIVSESIRTSRSKEAKERSSVRNREAPSTFQFRQGMYLHGLRATVLNPFIRNGNLCGEALGASAEKDSYPFHVDYSCILDEKAISGQTIEEVVMPLPTQNFGQEQINGRDGQVIAVTDRNQSKWEKGKIYYAGNLQNINHTLILGAAPTTEINCFLLRDPAASLPSLIQACVEEEHYIPAYAMAGNDQHKEGALVFTYEDYLRELAERKPYKDSDEFIAKTDYLDQYDIAQKSGGHRFTLKGHLVLATRLAEDQAHGYTLNEHETRVVQIAARLHDIGKGAVGEQMIDNPVVASDFLSQITGLSADDKELILNLIRYDELLGDILQGVKTPGQFERLFPDPRHRLMLLALYKADVQAIDGNEDQNSFYRQWQIEEKLKQLGLEQPS